MKTRTRLWIYLVAIALLIGASTGELSAQRTTAALTGTVTTDDGTTLNGARAVVTNMETGFQREAMTNASGIYRFELPVGTYSLRVEFEPFQPIIYEPINLHVADKRLWALFSTGSGGYVSVSDDGANWSLAATFAGGRPNGIGPVRGGAFPRVLGVRAHSKKKGLDQAAPPFFWTTRT